MIWKVYIPMSFNDIMVFMVNKGNENWEKPVQAMIRRRAMK